MLSQQQKIVNLSLNKLNLEIRTSYLLPQSDAEKALQQEQWE